jgi:uncharacterized protein YukE
MATTGMNLAEVRQLAEQLRGGAERLRAIVSTVDGRVTHSSWVGPTADRFKYDWWPGHRQMLLQAADHIQGLGQSARNNADEQERTSGIGGASTALGDRAGISSGWAAAAGVLGASLAARPWSLSIRGEGQTAAQAWRAFIKDPTVRLATERSLERALAVRSSGQTSVGGVPASYDASAQVYARAYESAGVKLDSKGLAAQATAGVTAGARADATGSLGNHHAGVRGHAYVEAEAGAAAKGELKAGRDGVSATAGVEAGAHVEVGADGRAHLSGVEAGGSVKAYAGVTAHAEMGGSVSLTEVKAHVDLGASVGIGGGVSFDINLKPAQVFSDGEALVNKWTKGWGR